MKKQKIVLSLFATSILLVALNYFAISNYWFWKFWWFDIVMHSLGGVVVALFAVFVYEIYKKENLEFKLSLVGFLIFFFIIALSWELFEYILELNPPEGYISDTLSDIVMGFLGFVSLLFIYEPKYFKKYE